MVLVTHQLQYAEQANVVLALKLVSSVCLESVSVYHEYVCVWCVCVGVCVYVCVCVWFVSTSGGSGGGGGLWGLKTPPPPPPSLAMIH